MEKDRISVTAIDSMGGEDSSAVAVVTEHGIIFDSFEHGEVGVTWESLLKIVKNQLVEARLLEAEHEAF